SQARAGIDIVAPSDMMDGRVAGIRKALDAAGLGRVPIMSYAAKMASAFYGPFREAAGSTPQFGDRQSYQMQGTNADEAMKEIRLDVQEGADIVMVKPALPCLDLIRRAKQEFGSPLAAYQVSGEYAMIRVAAERGMLDEQRAMWETLQAIRGASGDTAVPNTALTRKNVRIASIQIPCMNVTSAARWGVPARARVTAGSGRMPLIKAAPRTAPRSCARMYCSAVRPPILSAIHRPVVT